MPLYPVGDVNSCPTLIQFKRDGNDGKFDYHVTETTSEGTKKLEPTIPYSTNQPLAVVDPTAAGQRGVYALSDGYTLTPFQVLSCSKNPTYNIVAVDPSVQKAVWTSASFQLTSELVPAGAVGSLRAQHNGSSKVTVFWEYNSTSVDGFFVIVGVPSSKRIASLFVKGGSTTSATIDVESASQGSLVATVNVFGTNGMVGSPTNCPQVAVK